MSLPNELIDPVYLQEQQKTIEEAIAKSSNLNNILRSVSNITGYPISLLKGKGRKRTIVESRAAYGIVARQRNSENKVTLEDIGELINRDHATILHYTQNLSEIKEVKAIVNQII